MPATSPLFVMDIAYNAYLGLYIGEPRVVDQSGNAPQEIYATADLSKPQWTLIGQTDGYNTASWYRWFLDSAPRGNRRGPASVSSGSSCRTWRPGARPRRAPCVWSIGIAG